MASKQHNVYSHKFQTHCHLFSRIPNYPICRALQTTPRNMCPHVPHALCLKDERSEQEISVITLRGGKNLDKVDVSCYKGGLISKKHSENKRKSVLAYWKQKEMGIKSVAKVWNPSICAANSKNEESRRADGLRDGKTLNFILGMQIL